MIKANAKIIRYFLKHKQCHKRSIRLGWPDDSACLQWQLKAEMKLKKNLPGVLGL